MFFLQMVQNDQLYDENVMFCQFTNGKTIQDESTITQSICIIECNFEQIVTFEILKHLLNLSLDLLIVLQCIIMYGGQNT